MQNSTAETPQPSAETREPTTNELDQVAALLRGEPDQDDQGDQDAQDNDSENSEASSETNKSKGKPKNLDALAETLGVKVADLYDIEIPFADGDDVTHKTLGEVKDAMAEKSTFEVDRIAWEEQKSERDNQLARSTQELQEIVSMLPRSALSEQLINTVQAKRAETVETESRLTKQVIPEWTNEEVETKDRAAMREHLTEYGFPNQYLDNLVDHKTLRYIRESMLRQQRIERALAQVKTVRKPGHKPSGKPSGKPATPARKGRPSRVQSQATQVAELLKIG